MSTDEKRLLSALTDVINQWMNDEAEKDDGWTECTEFVGEQTSSLMADAAFAVFLAVAEAQRYAIREEYLSVPD